VNTIPFPSTYTAIAWVVYSKLKNVLVSLSNNGWKEVKPKPKWRWPIK